MKTDTPTPITRPTPAARYRVIDTWISAMDLPGTVTAMQRWIRHGERHAVHLCTSDTVVKAHDDPALAHAIEHATLVLPDGMPLVWLGRLRKLKVGRVYGPDLMLALCDAGRADGCRHYLYGAQADVLDALQRSLESRFPTLQIVGAESPPFRPLREEERAATVARINAAAPDVVWVGLGTPKQDFWTASFRPALHASVIIPVGAAFDFHAGKVKQAPRWLMRIGMEWAFRLCMEPRRLARRYLIGIPRFVMLTVLQWISEFTQGDPRCQHP